MKILISIFLCCISISISNAQDLSWIRQSEGYLVPLFMEKSADDRAFISGFVYQNSVYDQTTITTKGLDDVFVGEINENGDLLWQISFGSNLFDDRPSKLIVDDQNNRLIIVGLIGNGGSIGNKTCNLEDHNGFVAVFDFEGNTLGAEFLGGPEFDGIDNATIDSDGNITVIGDVFGEVEIANTTIGESFKTNSYIAQLDKNLNIQWVKDFDGFLQQAHIKQIDPDNIIVAGSYNSDITFDTINAYQTTSNQENILIFSIDNIGNPIWHTEMTGNGRNFIENLELWKNQILLIGSCSQFELIEIKGTVLAESNNFILTLEKDGSLSSIKNIATGFFNNNDVYITEEDELILTGSYTFQANINGVDLPTEFSQESYVLHMNKDDQIDWYKTFNGNLNDISVASVKDKDDNIIVLTYFGSDMMVEDTTIFTENFILNMALTSFSNDIFSPINQTDLDLKFCEVHTYRDIIRIKSDPYWNQSNFSLYSSLGELIYQSKINATNQEIITDFPSGAYHYLISNSKNQSISGTIIINH